VFTLLVVVTSTSTSCKRHVSEEDQASVLATLSSYRDRMCACMDAPCAQSVQAELSSWSAQLGDQGARPTEQQAKQLAELATQYGACLTKILVPASPSGADAATDAAP